MRHRKRAKWHGPANAWGKRPTFYSEGALKSALRQRSMALPPMDPAKMTPLARQQLKANA
jgi:hypothetical protein